MSPKHHRTTHDELEDDDDSNVPPSPKMKAQHPDAPRPRDPDSGEPLPKKKPGRQPANGVNLKNTIIRLPDDLHEQIRSHAADRGMPINTLLTKMIEFAIKRLKPIDPEPLFTTKRSLDD